MSSDIQDVILIAPQSKNQDGSQTFYILDPCPSTGECTDDPPEIELIDLTAEVKNTGAIAVLSTNSNTGALELTLTNNVDTVKIEDMDSDKDSDIIQQNGNPTDSNLKSMDKVNIDEDLSDCVIKDEDEEVDVEEISLNDIQNDSGATEHMSESESMLLEMDDDNEAQIEQDDEDEGVLYIDDAKYSELQEGLVQGSSEDLSNLEDLMVEEKVNVEDCTENNVEKAEIFGDKLKSESEGTSNEKTLCEEFIENSKECHVDATIQEAVIHGHLIKLPTESKSNIEESAEQEYADSTNTALTLLELAGGTSYRNSVDRVALEMEVIETAENTVPPSVQFVPSSEHDPPSESVTLTTLTTLQPVPLDTSSNSSCIEVVSVTNSDEVFQDKSLHPPSEVPSSPPGNAKVSNELVQRLIEGDTPMLIARGSKSQYKNRSSPIVSQDEIAQEILERSIQKCPYTEPIGGDVIFALKLAHRLATRIVPPDKSMTEKIQIKSEQETSVSTKADNNIISLSMRDPVSKPSEVNKTQSQRNDAISDKIELLKILEDDPNDISDLDQILEQKPKIRKTKPRASPLIKLHPELEKELALKQLEDFRQDQRKKKDFLPETLKKVPKLENQSFKQNHEHNNNLNTNIGSNQENSAKRKISNSPVKFSKKIKRDPGDNDTERVDPSQVTETLTVEGKTLVGDQMKDSKSLKQYSNKRLSRCAETPPREVPIEILLNGVDDELLDGEDFSKNKIFKATNSRKRKAELKRKHFANVLQRNKPQKKRGRPPKKKPILPLDSTLTSEFLVKSKSENKITKNSEIHTETYISNEEVSPLSKDEKPLKTKKMREIEQLLGDEGAINMLYSVEQKRTSGSEPKRGMLPSYRRKKKDLLLKTKLVKSAVLRLTTTAPEDIGRVSLRGQTMKDDENEENTDDTSLRKMSVDSHDSHHSLSSPPLIEAFPYPAKIVPAEASRIIRRHSSSSNYSSRSNSPRRLSIDADRSNLTSPGLNSSEVGENETMTPNSSKHNNRHGKGKESNLNREHAHTSPLENKKIAKAPEINQCKSKVQLKTESNENRARPGRPRKKLISHDDVKKRTELNTSLAAAVDAFTKDKISTETPKKMSSPSVPSPKVNTRTSTYKSKVAVYKKSTPSPRSRTPKSVVYHELTLKRHNHLVEINLATTSTTLKNAFNSNVLKELTSVLNGLDKDENCRLVLLTSSGNVFCQGVDFLTLIHPTGDQRMTAAREMAIAVKDFIKALAMFRKPVVAGVQGAAMGLGTTMLPLFDLVFASGEATFHTPYAKLGQVPEGAATLTFPTLLGSAATSELLFACRKLTATEAHHFGLVTRVLPTDNFSEELLLVVSTIASQSSQSMDATKALLRQNMLAGLETTLVSEIHLLVQHWSGAECQAKFNSYLQDEEQSLALQKRPT